MSNPYSEIQLFAIEQEIENTKREVAIENLKAIAEYLQDKNDTEKLVINNFLTSKVPEYSPELLTGYLIGKNNSKLSRKSEKLENAEKHADKILDTPEPILDQSKFDSNIGSRRTLTYKAISQLLIILPRYISRAKKIGNVNNPNRIDYKECRRLNRDLFNRDAFSDMSDSEKQQTANSIANGAQIVGALILAGASYVTLGWFGFYSFIDDVVAGSWTWLVGKIRNGVWKRIEKTEDEITAMTATKLGYTPDNIKKIRQELVSIRSQINSLQLSLGFTENVDTFFDKISDWDTTADDANIHENIYDTAKEVWDVVTGIRNVWFGCCVAYAAVVDMTKK